MSVSHQWNFIAVFLQTKVERGLKSELLCCSYLKTVLSQTDVMLTWGCTNYTRLFHLEKYKTGSNDQYIQRKHVTMGQCQFFRCRCTRCILSQTHVVYYILWVKQMDMCKNSMGSIYASHKEGCGGEKKWNLNDIRHWGRTPNKSRLRTLILCFLCREFSVLGLSVWKKPTP